MKTKLILLILVLFSTLYSKAQDYRTRNYESIKKHYLAGFSQNSQAKTTAKTQQLRASSNYVLNNDSNVIEIVDSSVFFYNGSTYTSPSKINFKYYINTSNLSPITNKNDKSFSEFLPFNRALKYIFLVDTSVQIDSFSILYKDQDLTKPSQYNYFTEDFNGNIIRQKRSYTYDAQGNLIEVTDTTMDVTMNQMQGTVQEIHELSANGNTYTISYFFDGIFAAKDSFQLSNNKIQKYYSIDDAGSILSISNYTYDNNGYPQNILSQDYTTMDTMEFQHFRYNKNTGWVDTVINLGNNQVASDFFSWVEYDSNGKIKYYYTKDIDSGFLISKSVFTVNSKDNIEKEEIYDDSSKLISVGYYFYDDITSIAPVTTEFSDLHVYPNPSSSDILYIESEEKMKALNVYDMQGKLIRRIEFSPRSRMEVSTSEMLPGQYILQLKSDKNQSSVEFSKL